MGSCSYNRHSRSTTCTWARSHTPGYKENAGIFCHNNPWIMIAETMTGNGDRAFDYYRRINPSARETIVALHRCEPYVYAQMIAGKDAPTHGEAKNSWLTGTAAWNYVAITQYILGIRPTYDGLMVAPVIPAAWKGIFRNPHLQRSAVQHLSNTEGERKHVPSRRRRTGGRGHSCPTSTPRCHPRRGGSDAGSLASFRVVVSPGTIVSHLVQGGTHEHDSRSL